MTLDDAMIMRFPYFMVSRPEWPPPYDWREARKEWVDRSEKEDGGGCDDCERNESDRNPMFVTM